MVQAGEIRIGIVGAGEVTRRRHIPGFLAIPGVKLTAVCNRRRESAARIAREFGIPKIHDVWENLVADDSIDAVLIGAWPYVHCAITLEALDHGKHVLTQARMAMNAREAQRMLDRSRELPQLTTMVVPSPYGLVGEAYMKKLLADGYIGGLRELHVTHLSDMYASKSTPLSWRQIAKYSGFNMLYLGILHESVIRWTPPVETVFAHTSRIVPNRVNPETGETVKVGIADSVRVLTEQKGGSAGLYRMSGVVRHEHEMSAVLFGSRGTLRYDFATETMAGAKAGESALAPLPIPADLRGGWSVEADFIAAIRGEKQVTHTDFLTGARYMQFTEAAARSSRHGRPVALPLSEFSNPSL